MSELIPLLRAIIQDELRALRLGDVGVVSKNEPHTGDGDAHNHTCDVKLRDQDVELKKVPICAPHLGVVSAPQVGELVLLSYVGGDPSRPIVIGRLYSDEFRPPLHEVVSAAHALQLIGLQVKIGLAVGGEHHGEVGEQGIFGCGGHYMSLPGAAVAAGVQATVRPIVGAPISLSLNLDLS